MLERLAKTIRVAQLERAYPAENVRHMPELTPPKLSKTSDIDQLETFISDVRRREAPPFTGQS